MASSEKDSEIKSIPTEEDDTYRLFLELQKKYAYLASKTSSKDDDIESDEAIFSQERKRDKKEAEAKEEQEFTKIARCLKKLTYNTISTPIFKGEKGQDPSTHVLRVSDWFESEMVEDNDRTRRFKLTLGRQSTAVV